MKTQNVLIAFDKFKDCMDASTACRIAKETIQQLKPQWNCTCTPLTDGGEGFADILTYTQEGALHTNTVQGSLPETEVSACWGIVDYARLNEETQAMLDLPDGTRKLAIIEMAQASGLEQVPPQKRNPWDTSTYGTGELIRLAVEHGADAILLGVGGSATNDLGLGALEALGLRAYKAHNLVTQALTPKDWFSVTQISADKVSPLPPIRIACDVSNPLLGERGCTAVYGPQKGLPQAEIAPMEKQLKQMAHRLCEVFDKDPAVLEEPGTGAAGGIACGLKIACDARIVPGFPLIERWLNLREKANQADILITGEGCFDQSSLSGKGPAAILKSAPKAKRYVLAGKVDLSEDALKEYGIEQAISISDPSQSLNENLKNAPKNLRERLSRLINDTFTES